MGLWWFGRAAGTHLVAVTYEGSGQLRLNGNRAQSKQIKRNAAAHSGTVCWIEFAVDGTPRDRGLGPSAGRLGAGEADRLLRELPRTAECRAVCEQLRKAPKNVSQWLSWGQSRVAGRGSMGDHGRA